MKVIVSTFPPLPDGIARYALQQAQYLKKDGEAVFTLGLSGSDADAVADLRGGCKSLNILRILRRQNIKARDAQVIIHWHDEFFYYGGAPRCVLTDAGFLLLFRALKDVTIFCHETYPLPDPDNPARKMAWRVHRRARQILWRAATQVIFHSQAERDKAEQALDIPLEDSRVRIYPHGKFFAKYCEADQPAARRELGIEADAKMFLCIGFLGEGKAFHRAIEAFATIDDPDARLFVVGSSLYDMDQTRAYIQRLRDLASKTKGVTIVEKFVSDVEFDTWISASDYVVAPYKQAFSSGVIERAKLFEKPVIANRVGGLPEQLAAGSYAFHTDEELAQIMSQVTANP